jgi:hypothetical protein
MATGMAIVGYSGITLSSHRIYDPYITYNNSTRIFTFISKLKVSRKWIRWIKPENG